MRALVLHPDIAGSRARHGPENALAEAVSLAAALDLEVAGAETVRLVTPKAGTLFGEGKVEEIGRHVEIEEIGLVIVDGPVSPIQQRNLERAWKAKVLDRTGLILEIFGDRAATREGVLQVDLAHLTYQKSRLVRSWTHLERQRGGAGFMGGPGETQIEADRRAIDDKIVRLKRQLRDVVRTRELHRAARAKVPFPIVALVGYTNAGKSTLFNRMTGAEVLAKDMLFATLDPTVRQIEVDGHKVLMSDTVGFISELPTQLVAAFRATLEEVLEADLILHVRDISHPETLAQAADVEGILEDLGAAAPVLEVWNKLDRLTGPALADVEAQAARRDDVAAISAATGQGIDALAQAILAALPETPTDEELVVPHSDGRLRARLYAMGVVQSERQTDTATVLTVRWTARQRGQFAAEGGDVELRAAAE